MINQDRDIQMNDSNTTRTIDHLRNFNYSTIDFLDTFKDQISNVNSDELGEKMIRSLKGMYSEVEMIKNEIIKIVDEKTKVSLLREIDRSNLKLDEMEFTYQLKSEKNNLKINFPSFSNNKKITSPKKEIIFDKKEIDILNKIVEEENKELDIELKKQIDIIQNFQKVFADEKI